MDACLHGRAITEHCQPDPPGGTLDPANRSLISSAGCRQIASYRGGNLTRRACIACGRPAVDQARCASCTVKHRKKTSYGPTWGNMARSIRERDDHRCVKCGRPCPHSRSLRLTTRIVAGRRRTGVTRTPAETGRCWSVDHVRPRALFREGDPARDLPGNLQTLCDDGPKSCHAVKTKADIIEIRRQRAAGLAPPAA